MTHQEAYDAARKVRDDLGRTGSVSVGLTLWEFDRPGGVLEEESWRISFQWGGRYGCDSIVQGSGATAREALNDYRQKMARCFASEPTEDLIALGM